MNVPIEKLDRFIAVDVFLMMTRKEATEEKIKEYLEKVKQISKLSEEQIVLLITKHTIANGSMARQCATYPLAAQN